MLKIAVFDGGYGGELFADRLEAELPIVSVIRVIAWREAEDFLKAPKIARKACVNAIRPYIGRVDLIVLANHLLSATSLKYFRRKYKNQKFIGLNLPEPTTFIKRPVMVLTTKSLSKTLNYYNYVFRMKRKVYTLCPDSWPGLIDDGELNNKAIRQEFENFYLKHRCQPNEIVVACSQFHDIIPNIRNILSKNVKIYDSFDDTIMKVCKTLKIRGGTGKKRK